MSPVAGWSTLVRTPHHPRREGCLVAVPSTIVSDVLVFNRGRTAADQQRRQWHGHACSSRTPFLSGLQDKGFWVQPNTLRTSRCPQATPSRADA